MLVSLIGTTKLKASKKVTQIIYEQLLPIYRTNKIGSEFHMKKNKLIKERSTFGGRISFPYSQKTRNKRNEREPLQQIVISSVYPENCRYIRFI